MLIYIGVGSNLGDRSGHIRKARTLLGLTGAVKLLRESPFYETEPVGGPPQGKFLNAVWEAETALPADDLMALLLSVEAQLGRIRTGKNNPRTIDLDLLFYGDEIIQAGHLTVPHPRLHERIFVLKPLADLNPGLRHPAVGQTVSELLERLHANHPAA